MVWNRYPRPNRPSPETVRTLADHHRDCARLTRVAEAAFKRGAREVVIPLFRGDQLRLKYRPPTDPEFESTGILLGYWMAYWEIDGLLRVIRPIDG